MIPPFGAYTNAAQTICGIKCGGEGRIPPILMIARVPGIRSHLSTSIASLLRG